MKSNKLLWAGAFAALAGFSVLALALSPALARGGGDHGDRGRNRGPGWGDERKNEVVAFPGTPIPVGGILIDQGPNLVPIDDEDKNEFRTTIALINVAGTAATGVADIRVEPEDGLFKTKVSIKVDNAGLLSGQVLEGWLVDVETGFMLSLGGFKDEKLDNRDRLRLQFDERLVNFFIFDRLLVTVEPLADTNPAQGLVILRADRPSTGTPAVNVVRMRADLSGAMEVPANTSTASGRGEFVVDTASDTLSFDLSFSGLTGMETATHIHGPAAAGATAGALFTLPTGTPKIGVWHYDPALEADILEGRTYVNVHSTMFPAGEIRGQILPR